MGGLLVIFAYVAALSPNVLFGGASASIFFLAITFVFSYILYFYPFTDYGEIINK